LHACDVFLWLRFYEMGVSVPVFSINPVFASVEIELVQVMAVVSAYVDIADGNVIFSETERVIEDSLSRAFVMYLFRSYASASFMSLSGNMDRNVFTSLSLRRENRAPASFSVNCRRISRSVSMWVILAYVDWNECAKYPVVQSPVLPS